MIDFVIGYILLSAIGAISGYAINQLPPISNLRENRGLLLVLMVEMIIGGAILAWIKENPLGKEREIIAASGYAILGAFGVTLAQLIVRNVYRKQVLPLASHSSEIEPQRTNPNVVVKGTKMKGNRNTVRVTKPDVWIEDTHIEGDEQAFLVDEDTEASGSSKGNR
jgi:hypothetical protein